jgi:hypothetical protein
MLYNTVYNDESIRSCLPCISFFSAAMSTGGGGAYGLALGMPCRIARRFVTGLGLPMGTRTEFHPLEVISKMILRHQDHLKTMPDVSGRDKRGRGDSLDDCAPRKVTKNTQALVDPSSNLMNGYLQKLRSP